MLGFEKNDYVMARTVNAGVFAGYLESFENGTILLTNARRMWYWDGAASLSELSQVGTIKPNECKFPVAVSKVYLTDVIEILAITDLAKKSIESVPVWTAKNI